MTKLVEGANGNWFWDLTHRQIGDGRDTSFWEGEWTSSSSLKSRFPCLFHLSTNRNAKVYEMGSWVQGTWKWNPEWRRDLRTSEQQIASDLLQEISAITVTENTRDRWAGIGNGNEGFSVKKMYKRLETLRLSPHANLQEKSYKMIWKSTAPFKAQVHAWRLIRNRIPTLENLRKRIDIPETDNLCCFCRTHEESNRHIFFECQEVQAIWKELIAWTGTSWAAPLSPSEHFQSFSYLLGSGRRSKNLSGLWICAVWVWWKHRNAIKFDKERWNPRRILEEIKCRFWNWCHAKGEVLSNFNYEHWSTELLAVRWHFI